MQSLNSFLNPKRKPNRKFVLSDAFVDERGKLIEWELRQLSAVEGIELQRRLGSDDYLEIMTCYAANALVYPNLRDKELLDALSEREKRPVLDPADALKCLLTDGELSRLITTYSEFNSFSADFVEAVDAAKN